MAFFDDINTNDMLDFDGIFNGEQKIIPDGTVLEAIVTGGFMGIAEGKTVQECCIEFSITTKGEFYGQSYRYKPKIFDMDARKRDLGKRNLFVLDAQAGMPMHENGLDPTEENIDQYWVGKSEFRVQFGLFNSSNPDDVDANGNPRKINSIRGFGYIREKMRPSKAQMAKRQAQQVQQPVQHPVQDDDILEF